MLHICFALPICFEFRLFQLFQAGRGEVENDQCSFLGQAHFGLCPGGPGGVERVRSGLLGRLVLTVLKESFKSFPKEIPATGSMKSPGCEDSEGFRLQVKSGEYLERISCNVLNSAVRVILPSPKLLPFYADR